MHRARMACLGTLIVLAAAAWSGGGAVRADDWPQFRGNAGKTGATTETLPLPLGVLWVRDLVPPGATGTHFSSPVTKDGRVYCAGGNVLYCMDAASGAVLWQYALPADIFATPAVAGGAVYAVARDGTAVKLSARKGPLNGKPLREVSLGGTCFSSPLATASRIAFGVGVPKREIRIYDARQPESLLTTVQTGQPVYAAPGAEGGRIVIGANDAKFRCLDEADGTLRWEFGIPTGEVDVVASAVSGNNVFLATTADSVIRALDLSTGAALWTVKPDGNACKTGSLAVTADRVFAWRRMTGFARNKLFCLDRATGTTLWTWDDGTPGGIIPGFVSSAGVAGNRVFVTADNFLKVFSTTSATPLESHPLGVVTHSSPTPSNGRVHVNANGMLYTYQGANYAPDAPVTGFSPLPGATVTGGSPTVSWNPANDLDDGPGTAGYLVRFDDDGEVDADYTREISVPAGQTGTILASTDLVPDTTITWRVRSVDEDGALSPWSLVQTFLYAPAPGDPGTAPQGLAAAPFDQGVALTWRAPLAGVPLLYAVSIKGPGDDGFDLPYWHTEGTSPVLVIRGLANGSTYSFAVSAIPALGTDGPAAFVSAVPNPGVKLVSADGSETSFSSIRAAAAAAVAGDTIRLGAAEYPEDPITLPAGVSIEGTSPSATTITASDPDAAAITVAGDGKKTLWSRAERNLPHITNVRVQGGETGISTGNEAVIRVENVILTGNQVGMTVGDASYAVVKNVTFANNALDGLRIPSHVKSKLEIRNNIFSGHGKAAVRGPGSGKKESGSRTTYCLFHANGVTHADGAQSGVGDTSFSGSLFADARFHERPGTPAVDGGKPGDAYSREPVPNGSRINVGAYGNTPEATPAFTLTGSVEADALPEEGGAVAAEDPLGATGAGGCFIGSSRTRR